MDGKPRSSSSGIMTRVDVRFVDTDAHGHVNNSHIATYFEIGRDQVLRDGDSIVSAPSCTFVLAQYTVRFIHEVTFPGVVSVESTVESIGRSSVTLRQVLRENDIICAESTSTIVHFCTETRRAKELPDDVKSFLTRSR